MPEKPIIFNGEMVQAILEGRKTQTRRIIKPQPIFTYPQGFCTDSTSKKDIGKFGFGLSEFGCKIGHRKPICSIGDILWVRETWCKLYDLDSDDQRIDGTGKYYYAADENDPPYGYFLRDDGTHGEHPEWRPSIHMPREAARIFLQVTDVRVERVQEINSDDCVAEGMESVRCCVLKIEEYWAWYRELWDSIYAKHGYGWDINPWVWVIKFERTVR